jgi:hypothetical protein
LFLERNYFMKQPSLCHAPSYSHNSTLRPRVAQRNHSLVHLEDEEATCMSARISETFALKKRPVEEYRTLHARAYPIERDPEPPPVDATLTRVDYDLRIDGELASGRASLTVDVLKDGWVRVPVPAGLLVREARLDSRLVR